MHAISLFLKTPVGKWKLVALFFLVLLPGQAQHAAEAITTRPVSPGPAMWRVERGENTLWIFGILTPLEYGVNWQSDDVESVIGQSREFVYFKNPEVKIPVNPIKLVNGLRLVMKLRYSPDDKTLEDVLPADLYQRFSALLKEYPFGNDVQRVRPYFAADGLRGSAVIYNSLTEDHGVDIKIHELVKKNKSIKTTAIPFGIDAIDYDFLKASAENLVNGASLTDEIRCLEVSVESIENDMPGIQARARAWASGDIEALHQYRGYQQALDVCKDTYLNIDTTRNVFEEAYRNFVQAAEQALHNNKTTFAALEIDQLIGQDGVLERLRNKGYSIVVP